MDIDNVCNMFRGKRVTVLGLGLLGRGVGDAEFIARCGARVLVTDKKSEAELADSIERLKKHKNITIHVGGHRDEDFIECDMVIKAAGVPLGSPEIAVARNAGVPIYMSTALFAKFAMDDGIKIVGVTGTRGKSTVAHMIYRALKDAGKRVFLGGNVRGVSTLAMLPEVQKGDIVVLELDSWQLQGFGDLEISPHVAVFTNLLQDHVNYYPTKESYFADKENIYKNQKPSDVLIVGAQVRKRVGKGIVPPTIPSEWKLKILGEHNRENASLAKAALEALGVAEEDMRAGLESFGGVDGRLQFVREVRGVKIYNDNNATTPEATIAALRALGNPARRNIVLIVGGDDKKLDMSALVAEIPKWCSKVVLFKERGTDHIRDAVFALESSLQIYEEDDLKACVARAACVAVKGETILYSPAFSSFGKYFKNEFDRNDQFMDLVKKL